MVGHHSLLVKERQRWYLTNSFSLVNYDLLLRCGTSFNLRLIHLDASGQFYGLCIISWPCRAQAVLLGWSRDSSLLVRFKFLVLEFPINVINVGLNHVSLLIRFRWTSWLRPDFFSQNGLAYGSNRANLVETLSFISTKYFFEFSVSLRILNPDRDGLILTYC
jgi:hypothetical protein